MISSKLREPSFKTISWFHRLLPGIHQGLCKKVKPLNDLLVGHPTNKHDMSTKKKQKTVPWQWGKHQQDAFDSFKFKLSTPPVVAYGDFTTPFIDHTDASGEGLGAVLYQEQNSIERVIAYASRELHRSERNHPAHNLEFFVFKMGSFGKVP